MRKTWGRIRMKIGIVLILLRIRVRIWIGIDKEICIRNGIKTMPIHNTVFWRLIRCQTLWLFPEPRAEVSENCYRVYSMLLQQYRVSAGLNYNWKTLG